MRAIAGDSATTSRVGPPGARIALAAAAFACALVACAEPEPAAEAERGEGSPPEATPQTNLSPNARPDVAQTMLDDLTATPHPGDGGGRAWLVSLRPFVPEIATSDAAADPFGEPVDAVPAGSRARIRIGYEVGEEGIAQGGVLFLQSSQFWRWEPAQAVREDLGGFTKIVSQPEGVSFEPKTYNGGIVGFEVQQRALRPGERVEVEYGAGPRGAVVDEYADAEARVWILVDADGDRRRAPVDGSPFIRTLARRPAHLVLRHPTTARPGDLFEMRVSIVDRLGNGFIPQHLRVEFDGVDGLELPRAVDVPAEARGTIGVPVEVKRPGFFRIRARAVIENPGAGAEPQIVLNAESAPLLVREGAPRVLWADLHGHSSLSDGTGTPADFYRYAREIGGLDVAALTDHDHWGMRALGANPAMWRRIRDAVKAAHDPGRFVALLGYEWTSWLHGHRHVLYFDHGSDGDPLGEVLSSIDAERRFETPEQLWAGLRERNVDALTFAHHSAGGPVATNWNYAPDPVFEPVTEIMSAHGSSEAPDSPRPIYSPVAGNFVRDVLDRGYEFGFIGSGDSHDGHPGLTHLSAPSGNSGIAAIFAEERTRAAVLEAIRARRVYATSGPRIFLNTTLDGVHPMGARVGAPPDGGDVHELAFRIGAVAPLERVDVVRSGQVIASLDAEGAMEFARAGDVPRLGPGDYVYVRAVQRDSGVAWSSPYYGPERD